MAPGPAQRIMFSRTSTQHAEGIDIRSVVPVPQNQASWGNGFKRSSAPIKRPGKLENALRRRIPSRRGVGVVVKVTPHAHQFGALGEGEVAAHRRTGHGRVELRQLRTIDEIDAPFAFDMRAAVEHVIWRCVGVAAKPEIDRTRMLGHIALEDAHRWMATGGIAKAQLGADAEAVVWLRRSIDANRNNSIAHFGLAAVLARL